MKLTITVLLLVYIQVATCSGGDLDLLQGTWKLIHCNQNGTNKAIVEGSRMHIAGDQFVEKSSSQYNGVFLLQSATKTKTFEQFSTDPGQKRSVLRGIYQLEHNTFRQCRSVGSDSVLPLDFSATKGSGQSLMVWKRVGRVDKSLAKSDDEILVGSWSLESLTTDGWQPSEEKIRGYQLTVDKQGWYTFTVQNTVRGSLRLSEFTTPKQMDFDTITPDRVNGNIAPGIYRVEGHRLEVNRSLTSMEERPSQFGDTLKTSHLIYERCNP